MPRHTGGRLIWQLIHCNALISYLWEVWQVEKRRKKGDIRRSDGMEEYVGEYLM